MSFSKITGERSPESIPFISSKHNFINIDQYAFLPNHSTNTCSHKILDDWYDSFNEHKMVGTCTSSLDISKGFDCIDNKVLLQKLERYLSGRKQTVYCHEILSRSKSPSFEIVRPKPNIEIFQEKSTLCRQQSME